LDLVLMYFPTPMYQKLTHMTEDYISIVVTYIYYQFTVKVGLLLLRRVRNQEEQK
jgi:hypothetical protein